MSQFIIIGLDGAEPTLINPWIDQGLLPNLAALRARGKFLPLQSVTPPATFPAWTSCVTGMNPGRHGIFDFTEIIKGQYALRFINATYRKAPAVWQLLSQAGKRVCVISVPATYPPEEVNGIMISGFDSPVATSIDRSFVYPPELYEEVKGWRFSDIQESNIDSSWHNLALPTLLNKIAVKEEIVLKLLRREPWDFFMVVFGESDTIAHHYWMFHDPHSPRFRPGHETAIQQIYQRLDETVGKIVAAAPDATIAIVSDHGFGGAGTGVVHLNNWLAEQGYLRFSNNPRGSLLKKIALNLVPNRWRGPLFRRLAGMAARAESHSRFGGIDWEHTSAWSEELNYFPSIRINLKGREAQEQVEPADYDNLVAELCARLEAWPIISKAWPRAALYAGDYVDRAPDIVLELALENGYSHSCLRSRGGPPFRRIRSDEYLGGKEKGMNGNHRPAGVLILSEPTHAECARLEDIAPTGLARLGVPATSTDGSDLFSNEKPAPTQGQTAATPAEQPYTAEESAILEERLRALGYFE